MAHLELSFLGGWQVSLDGRPVTGFESAKVRALLSYLAVEAGRPHYREALAGLLWPEVSEAAALASLRQALANLRKCTGDRTARPPFLLITRNTIRFNCASDCAIDVVDFTALLDACDRHAHRRMESCRVCAARLQRAAALYHGDFLEGLFVAGTMAFEEWSLLWRERLRQLALAALGRLAAYHEHRADYDQAVGALARLVELDPWREEAHRQLMRVYFRSGRRGAALAQYQTCRRLLAEELAVEPAADTVALYQQIRAGALEPDLAGAPRLLNWPHSPTPLIGREIELAELAEMVANPECRLLTILGPGGMGKSRLALEVAAAEAWSFSDGAAFVPLTSLSSATYLAPTIAQALGVALSSLDDPRQQLIHALREREMLIVLDSFEHLRDGSDLLSKLLVQAPGLQLVVTSRERLDVEGEWLLELDGLSYPSPETPESAMRAYSAAQLFLSSARRADATFDVAKGDAAAVGRICSLVGGMPLAIELAAAWVRVISCAEIVQELEQGLAILSTARGGAAGRHGSLRSVFDQSWQLLNAEEQRAFRSLSVFAGGFEREAAEQVAGVTLPLLSLLVDKTLVRWDHRRRYDMHELIAEYAHEKLRESGDENAIRERHAGYMLQLAERAEPELRGPHQKSWLDRLDADRDNLRQALDWALRSERDQDLELGLRMVSALGGFWWMRGMREGRDWLAALLARPRAARRTLGRARALALAGDLAIEHAGDNARARRMYEESLSLSRELEDGQSIATSLLGMGAVARASGDMAGARALLVQSLTIWQELDEKWGIAWALHDLGDLAFDEGDLVPARVLYEQSLALREEVGDRSGIAWLINNLGEVDRYAGRYEQARALYEKSLRLHREVGNSGGVTAVLSNMGYAALNQGQRRVAKALFRESLSQNLGREGLTALCLIGLAGAARQAEHAARLLGAAEAYRDSHLTRADRADYERIAAAVRAQLDESAFAAAWEAGRSMSLDLAIKLAHQDDPLPDAS
jgi:predicted ATPase/DNA-binding SARP family transcriptional activator/Tfp pilus assembly protein PilF